MRTEDYYKQELLRLMREIGKDRTMLELFLEDLLTPAEYREIALRWQIIKQLHQGTAQRKIAKQLGVGVGTITRGSRELLDPEGGFARALKMCEKHPTICKV